MKTFAVTDHTRLLRAASDPRATPEERDFLATMASPYITHITLTTGHVRRSPRDEVGDDILGVLHPWLAEMLASGVRQALPVPALSHYSSSAAVEHGGLVCTVWGPAGPHLARRPHAGEVVPLITLVVAQRSRQGPDLWALMLAQYGGQTGLQRPAEPWCAVAIHPTLTLYPDTVEWLGDFERCLAWAWITRAPRLVLA